MLWTICVILLILWLLGLISGYTMGGVIHILLAIAMTERAGSAGRTAPAHYAHFQPAILTGFGMTKRQHCGSKYQNVKSSLKQIGENCGLTAGENYIPRLLDQESNSE